MNIQHANNSIKIIADPKLLDNFQLPPLSKKYILKREATYPKEIYTHSLKKGTG